MHGVLLLCVGLYTGDVRDYSRSLDAKKIDQTTLDAEGYGEKKKLGREKGGLRVKLEPGEAETGWKTPQALRFGGDFRVTANFVVHKLPKPAQDDGAAVGVAIATQNVDQPDATLVRVIEPSGSDVYRSISKAAAAQGPQGMPGAMPMPPNPRMGMQAGGKPVKPPRQTFPAKGESFRLELKREGSTLRYYVLDGEAGTERYLGQLALGAGDIAGVKLFAVNRNGAEALDVVLRDLTIRADRVSGLGTEVRTVFGEIIHGEPTAIEDGKLIVGGPPPAAPPTTPAALGTGSTTLPADVFAPKAATPEPSRKAAETTTKPGEATPKVEEPKAGAADKPSETAKANEAKEQKPEKAKDADAKDKPKDATPAKAPAPPPKVEPKARIPLDEVEGIAFEKALTLSGRVLGQPNLDFTMPAPEAPKDGEAKPDTKTEDVLAPPPGTVAPKRIPKVEPKPNGICDLHLTLANLRPAAIKQVTVNVQTDKGATAWRLDTTDSRDWPLVVRRAGAETWADLFLEPPAGDVKGKDLTVAITYADGQSGNATIKSDKPSNPKLAVDPKAQPPSSDARVYLTGDEQLFGKFEELGEDSVRLETPWGDRLTVPLDRIAGIYMGLPEHKESSESFAKRLRTRGTEDLLLARSKADEVIAIPGIAERTEADKLLFRFEGKTRSLSLKQVEGLVLAARPAPARPEGLRPIFSMAGGVVVSGLWKTFGARTWKVETAWGESLELPAADVRSVRCRGGVMTYLSDVEPSRVEETAFFGRRSPWRKDVSLAGTPLKMDGIIYEHGLAVHSRSALTFDLDGGYSTFDTVLGFDESAGKLGRVDCRVFADDKAVYANPDLRADAAPVNLSLPVAKARQLRLVVDFGADQDTGDRVIWANARLFRRPPSAPAASAGASAAPAPRAGPGSLQPQAPSSTTKPGSGQ